MFKELDGLGYSDLIKVCHAILAEWDGSYGAHAILPAELSIIVEAFLSKYDRCSYFETLMKYIKSRSDQPSHKVSMQAVKAFFGYLDAASTPAISNQQVRS